MSGLVRLNLAGDYPSLLSFDVFGGLTWVSWVDSIGQEHRENGLPATIDYHENYQVAWMKWCVHGEFYRENDWPSSVWFYSNGKVQREEWLGNFGNHRVTGPALIKYTEKGKIQGCVYSLDGVELDKTEWVKDSRVKRILKNHGKGVLVSEVSL